MRNDHFTFRIGKGKIAILGAFAPETRRKNRDTQKLMIRSWYYGGFYIGISWFCDKKISALRHPLPLDFGGRSLVGRPKITIFDLRWGPWGVAKVGDMVMVLRWILHWY